MLIRSPSYQKKYDAFWTLDPAIVPLPKDASDDQKKEHARKIELARETGRADTWLEITNPGDRITVFALRPLTADEFGELASMIGAGVARYKVWSLAFRLALIDAAPLPEGIKVKHAKHPTLGDLASLDFLDEIGMGAELAALLVMEIGELAYDRARDVSPKS